MDKRKWEARVTSFQIAPVTVYLWCLYSNQSITRETAHDPLNASTQPTRHTRIAIARPSSVPALIVSARVLTVPSLERESACPQADAIGYLVRRAL